MNKTAPYLLIKAGRLLKATLKSESNIPSRNSIPFHLLALLTDKPSTVLEIAEKLSCSKQEASRLIKAAESNSLISIVPSETDKRVKNVSLAKGGRELLKGGADLYATTDEHIRKLLGDKEYKSFKQSLEKICCYFD
jgi:DNA-binding MarR family transcriptional regulator